MIYPDVVTGITAVPRPFGLGCDTEQPVRGLAMFREIIEVVGPITLKALAAAAGLVVFAPLLAAWFAPAFS